MSVPDETMPLAVWARTERTLITAYEYATRRVDKDVVVRTANEWRAAYIAWLAESDL